MTDIFLLSYNKAQWLEEGIKAALDQEDVDVYVIDDCSTDNSREIIAKYPVKQLFNYKNLGMVGSLRKAASWQKSKYMAVISAEDPLKPGIIKEMVKVLDKRSEINFVGCWYDLVDIDGRYLWTFQTEWHAERLLRENCMSGHFISRKGFYNKVNWRDVIVNGVNGYNDWDLWLQCVREGLNGLVVPLVGFSYRQHPSITSGSDQYREEFIKKIKLMNNL